MRYDLPDQPQRPDEYVDPSGFALCPDDDELTTLQRTMFEGLTLTVVRHDGAWYISPIGTQLDTTLAALRSLDPAEVEAAIGGDGPSVIGIAVAPMFQLALRIVFRTESSGYDDGPYACQAQPVDGGGKEVICEEPPPTAAAPSVPALAPEPRRPTPATSVIGRVPITYPPATAPVPGTKTTSDTPDPTQDPPALPLPPSTTTP